MTAVRGVLADRPRRERGAALILVLWITAALSAIAVELTGDTRIMALQARNTVEAVRLRAAIDGSLQLAAKLLEAQTFARSGVMRWRLDSVDVRVRATPESGRIDLNGAAPELIEGLARAVIDDPERARDVAGAILDWRDADDLEGLHGAEGASYARAGRAFGPADGRFRHTAELRAVLGVSGDDYRALAPLVTVHTGADDVEEQAMPALVARACDLARGLVVDPEAEAPRDEGVAGFVADANGLYRLRIEATLAQTYRRTVEAVIWVNARRPGRPFEILAFRGHVPADQDHPMAEEADAGDSVSASSEE